VSFEGRAPEWTFGGGTSLAIDLGHRISYDIDAFMDSAKVIHALAPNRNDVTREICWNDVTGRADYQWPGHYLKLFVADVGEIDFLSSARLTDDPVIPFTFEGRPISRERPAEVMAKKIYHRGSTFKARDVFDLAGTFLVAPDELTLASGSLDITSDVIERVRTRIRARESAFAQELAENINPTEFGRSYSGDSVQLALEALDFMDNKPKNNQKPNRRPHP
jgi:hypothetical protein